MSLHVLCFFFALNGMVFVLQRIKFACKQNKRTEYFAKFTVFVNNYTFLYLHLFFSTISNIYFISTSVTYAGFTMQHLRKHVKIAIPYDRYKLTYVLQGTQHRNTQLRVNRFGQQAPHTHTHTRVQHTRTRRFSTRHSLSAKLRSNHTHQHGPATCCPLHAPNGAAEERAGKPLAVAELSRRSVAQPTKILHNVTSMLALYIHIHLVCVRCYQNFV